MCLTIGWWIWAGSPVGAAETNDTGLAKRELENMTELMHKNDLLITDRAFRSLREKLNLLCGWTKQKAKQLTLWQKQETTEISQQRGK
jgi:hypothetical protein